MQLWHRFSLLATQRTDQNGDAATLQGIAFTRTTRLPVYSQHSGKRRGLIWSRAALIRERQPVSFLFASPDRYFCAAVLALESAEFDTYVYRPEKGSHGGFAHQRITEVKLSKAEAEYEQPHYW